MKYDFSGYATKNDLKCADGRVIRRDAFKDNDGSQVPLVWQHLHDDPTNVLGHAILENREDGVYAYGTFNDTEQGQHAKQLVKHGDITSMSIFANQLMQNGSDVVHGVIREVSLVLSGANPGARIENLSFAHNGIAEIVEEEAFVYADQPLKTISHASNYGINYVNQNGMYHANSENGSKSGSSNEKTVEDVWNSMTEEQQNVAAFLVGQALEDAGEEVDVDENEVEVKQSDDMEDNIMKHNVFSANLEEDNTLSHDAMKAIIEDAQRDGSLKNAFLEHGITNIDTLFPEAKAVAPTPDMITRQMEWVSEVWNATKKSPFSRIKSVAANLTEDDARAKGYIKGNKKVEEQFGLLKRETTPQTVYKKQALDRDDIIDIVDLDVVAWLKAEMRMMLDEELARAILVGDGRSKSSADKIKEDNIRPIYQDADMYTIHYEVSIPKDADETDTSNALLDAALRSRKDYRGSGTPVFYASVDVINDMLLAKDKIGRRLYSTTTELADAMRVSKIVEVPVLDGVTRTDDDSNKYKLLGLIVNLSDYTVGADRQGAVSLFDDFDIDYNKEKYLIETRCSGCLTKPYSAIALEVSATTSSSDSSTTTPTTPTTVG